MFRMDCSSGEIISQICTLLRMMRSSTTKGRNGTLKNITTPTFKLVFSQRERIYIRHIK
jgi:hypothetical protein